MTTYQVFAAENRLISWEMERDAPFQPGEEIVDPTGATRRIIRLFRERAWAELVDDDAGQQEPQA